MGNPVCCPSVTFNMELMPEKIFTVGMKSNVDWEAWEKLSRLKGGFLYATRPLCYHRIHQESTTSEIIADNGRTEEDYQMYCKFGQNGLQDFCYIGILIVRKVIRY